MSRYLPGIARHMLVAIAAAVGAGLWLHVFDWPATGYSILVLAVFVGLQEARIIALHNRLDDHLDDVELRRGPIVPEHDDEPHDEDETPWLPAQPVNLDTLQAPATWPHDDDQPRPITGPRPSPRAAAATTPVLLDADWKQRMDAQWAQLEADIEAMAHPEGQR